MKYMEGKKGLVVGIANQHSIAWAIAEQLHAAGAVIGTTYGGENLKRRVEGLSKRLDAPYVAPCDVTSDDDVNRVCQEFAECVGGIDFIVHAVAFAPGNELQAGVINTSRNGFQTAMDVTAYSFISLAHAARPYLNPGASLLSLSYLGSERVCAGYNIMGVAKAALEASARYLASELGEDDVRVNVISAGPIRTSAAIGLPNFQEMLTKRAEQSPIRRNVTHEDVANGALYLLSDLSRGTSGTVLWVDGGYNIMGTWADDQSQKGEAHVA